MSECRFTNPSASEPNKRSIIILKSNPSMYINAKYTINAPAKAAIALFSFPVIIQITTPIKQPKAIIILRIL